jgi:SpoVK/Ycf46/Vps4 family AAA+-type ATPase
MKLKYKNRTTRCFSPTHINSYNNLLKTLDEKQKETDLSEKRISETFHNPPENNFEKEKHFEDILKSLSDSFKIYDSKWITGTRETDVHDFFDPNVYVELKDKKRVSIRPSTPSLLKELEKNVQISAKYTGPKEKKDIFVEIQSVSDLLKLIEDYTLDEKIEYNINLESIHNIKEPLIELNNMIGMRDLKENIVDQILYFSQNLHKITHNGETSGDYMHTVIYGPPGTGKTEIARIMGKIYSKMGILKRGIFKKVTRSDLIAGYLGQTAMKTKDVINDCLGGVLFIDEAYALGNSEKRDSFSKECIDTLCEALSAHKDNLMVIIAGYENELKECFFNYNQGLDSRFTWRFKTEDYKTKELFDIFLKKVKDIGWSIDNEAKNINESWFERNRDYFKYFGRDMEVLLSKIKIAHSKRVFCKSAEEKTKITFCDLEKGFELYLKNDDVKKRKEESSMKFSLSGMYL